MGRVIADDARFEWVRPTRHGREAGCSVYIDTFTLREALRAAGIPEDTKPETLEVRRYVLKKGGATAQVLLKFRPQGSAAGGDE